MIYKCKSEDQGQYKFIILHGLSLEQDAHQPTNILFNVHTLNIIQQGQNFMKYSTAISTLVRK